MLCTNHTLEYVTYELKSRLGWLHVFTGTPYTTLMTGGLTLHKTQQLGTCYTPWNEANPLNRMLLELHRYQFFLMPTCDDLVNRIGMERSWSRRHGETAAPLGDDVVVKALAPVISPPVS